MIGIPFCFPKKPQNYCMIGFERYCIMYIVVSVPVVYTCLLDFSIIPLIFPFLCIVLIAIWYTCTFVYDHMSNNLQHAITILLFSSRFHWCLDFENFIYSKNDSFKQMKVSCLVINSVTFFILVGIVLRSY